MSELKPCPFCGSDGIVHLVSRLYRVPYYYTGCTNDRCILYSINLKLKTRKDAVELWNARTQPPAGKSPTGRAERLAEELRNAARALKDARIEAEFMGDFELSAWASIMVESVNREIKEQMGARNEN